MNSFLNSKHNIIYKNKKTPKGVFLFYVYTQNLSF